MICPFCKGIINKNDGNHIYRCLEKPNKDKKELRYLYVLYNFPEISIKKTLMKKYQKELCSLPDIEKEYGIPYTNTLFLLDYFNIHKRTAKESANLITMVKYKKTCLSKYGVDNVSNLDIIKEKKKQTFTKHYGVDNIWKSKEYYEWLHKYMFDTYGKKSLPNRYGNMNKYYSGLSDYEIKHKMDKARTEYIRHWYSLTDEQKTELIQKRYTTFKSKLETLVSDSLSKLNISFRSQYWVGRKSFDFKIEPNILIEVNGDFWHGNPVIYKGDDIIPQPFKSVKAKELWDKDEKKKTMAENKGYKVIYIWESELKENKNNILDFVVERLTL